MIKAANAQVNQICWEAKRDIFIHRITLYAIVALGCIGLYFLHAQPANRAVAAFLGLSGSYYMAVESMQKAHMVRIRAAKRIREIYRNCRVDDTTNPSPVGYVSASIHLAFYGAKLWLGSGVVGTLHTLFSGAQHLLKITDCFQKGNFEELCAVETEHLILDMLEERARAHIDHITSWQGVLNCDFPDLKSVVKTCFGQQFANRLADRLQERGALEETNRTRFIQHVKQKFE